jgi:hypothetical protein
VKGPLQVPHIQHLWERFIAYCMLSAPNSC